MFSKKSNTCLIQKLLLQFNADNISVSLYKGMYMLLISAYIPYKIRILRILRFFLAENKKNKETYLLTMQGELACENC